ncbi:tyrosine-protein kinase Shark isoform X2 [Parasteatoda tepidariorum]|uniref:tyrosine-protein kinase Shark isoform X2 n=1 Tax=Parasteatoda tepidariorum TaxID=114398 RepID=UPI001C725CFF|nr:tyrosine-protein kinase SYK isoform X1 [Parasteatoda tepidariorum]XP_042898991.1 tyrosine-protein kinase SYK isoform X1 [Parasteatoda tepidariorum]XP_042898992.1 tyrosine-protein kinase SYK isoform X1 [Parasteatoda tepidariorum]XP_042898993.1 tyrosine-protein kinase SYK isoform X1 [Parasteatoda tepidariorum]XP_042898994.1 tyrosine-protein kinase SYK isoform X1 [Parasteatoda tepidariorum]
MVKTGYNAVSRLASLLGFCCKDVTNMTESSTIEVTVLPVPVESMLYYYGSISRETAEWILWDRGCRDGMYLLRESNSDYVLSLCYQKSVLHYRIKKLSSGEVGLCGVPRQKFAGPVELVQGVEGLACKPTLPCNKSLDSVLPLTHWGVTEEVIRKAILRKAKEWGIDEDKLDTSLTESYSDIKLLITKTLHEIQPWFHGILSRVEAEQAIEDSGHKDGKFLVRERDDSSYALCLSHSGRIKHYKIDVLPSGEFAIQDGQRFPSIMALVSHYTLFSDGLWCSLQDPCVVPPRRSSDNTSSQSRTRSSDINTDRTSNHHQSGGGTLERNKSSSLRQGATNSEGGSPPSKASRFLNSLNQRKLFSKIFSSVAPQFSSQTLPQNANNTNPSTSNIRSCLYPSLSDDNLESGDLSRSVHARISPELIGTHPSTPPTSSRKSSFSSVVGDVSFKEGKKGNIQKASSFDFLPAFLSLFIYGDGTMTSDRKVKKGTPESCHRKTKIERDKVNDATSNCNGATVHSLSRIISEESKRSHKTMPVPAPRLSLARKLSRRTGPVYANREALAATGRSISLGENASSIEENVTNKTVQNGLPIPQSFIRSASSPSVVSHSKVKAQLPAVPTRLSTSEGCEPIISCITSVINESCRASSLNGHLNSHPVPKPRKKIPVQESDTSCESCASVDSSTSPTLTEISEFGQESFSEDIFPSDIVADEIDLLQDSTPLIEMESLHSTNPDLQNETNGVSLQDTFMQCDFESSRTQTKLSSGGKPPCDVSELSVVSCDSNIYATLSGSSDVICLLSNDVPSPPSSTPANATTHCPEGILIDLDISDNDLNTLSNEESELAYLTLRQCRRGPLNLDQKSIDLKEKIGTGIFCDVFRGVFSSGPVEVQFAIKTLKCNSVPNPKSEILKEAQTMIALDHPHIVRLIGVSESSCFMLVMELAPLGPLSKYLKIHREISICEILLLMLQVASAMEYLESKQFVHRDLAARNVLLVNESFVKISDFGMSRALGLGKEYYRAETAGKWPLKWYAPECIYYFKFSSKSDVWSFGVTLWEAVSYGEKPYHGMIGRDILKMFERNERLMKPESCPESAYNLMRRCWEYKAEDRPTFAEIYEILKDCIGNNV